MRGEGRGRKPSLWDTRATTYSFLYLCRLRGRGGKGLGVKGISEALMTVKAVSECSQLVIKWMSKEKVESKRSIETQDENIVIQTI